MANRFTSQARSRLTYLTYRGLGSAMALLPEPVANTSASLVGAAMTQLSHKSKDTYLSNLSRVLGKELDRGEGRVWARKAFMAYARYWLEGARLPTTPARVVQKRMTFESGLEHLKDGMAQGRGVIMAIPHIGSWEWGAAWLAISGYRMTAVAEILQPLELFEWFVSQREAIGLSILPLDSHAGSGLLRTLRAGGLVGLLCDRDIGGGGTEVDFFGERTTLPSGPATMALRTGATLLPAAVYSGPGAHHTAVIMGPVKAERTGRLRQDVQRVTQLLAYDLEKLIRRAPEQWHVFQPNWPSQSNWPSPHD